MHESQIIVVEAVDASNRHAVLQLDVSPQQRSYVGAIVDLLVGAEHCGDGDTLTFRHGPDYVGYCRLDAHARSVAGRDFELPARGLRGFFIDARWQGRGLGSQALQALLAWLPVHDRATRLLVLTVNCGNEAALALYRRAGFQDSGELYHGGRAGPQHLLLRYLDRQPSPPL